MTVNIRKIADALASHPTQKIRIIDPSGFATSYSFRDLLSMVELRKEILGSCGLVGRTRIGISLEDSIDFIAWDIAILLSDHVSVVFSEAHRATPLDDLAKKYGCAAIISRASCPGETYIIGPDTLPNSFSPRAEYTEDESDIYTMVFSSGTTGRLKGLFISESGTDQILSQFVDAYTVGRYDRYYSCLPFSYFQQRALYMAAILAGAQISIGTPDRFLQDLSIENPTYMINPPIFYEAIYRYMQAKRNSQPIPNLKDVLGGNIRWMITAMAPISAEILNYFWKSGVSLFETYGVTETGIVAWNTPENYKIGTVGKPAKDGELIVSDDGEILCTRTNRLTIGYFDSANEFENETFLPDGSVATGDIGVIDSDGFISLLGRKKNAIVSKSGKKFHPEVVESLYANSGGPGVSILVGGGSVKANTLIVALESADDPEERLPNLVKSACQRANEYLSDHMKIRRTIMVGDIFQTGSRYRTRNHKFDRAAILCDVVENKLVGLDLAI